MLPLLLLAATASAHPSSLRIASHRIDVAVDADDVTVMYAVEVPVHDPSDLQDPGILASGIVVEADGRTVPLSVRMERAGRTGHVHTARLTLHGDVDDAETLRVSVGNHPHLPGYFTWSFAVDRALWVHDADLEAEGRRLVGDAHRAVTLSLTRDASVGGRLWRALTPGTPQARPLSGAVRPASSEMLHTNAVTPTGFLAALGACVGLGLLSRGGGRWAAVVPLVAAVGVVLPGGVGAALQVALGGLAVAAAGLGRSGAVAVALAGSALALSLGATGPTLLALGLLGAAMLIGRSEAPRRRLALVAALVGALAVARGLGALGAWLQA